MTTSDTALPHNTPLERVGERIGRYKLLEKIGEGGCGVVYVAEQSEPVRRRVAVKVIKLGMDTRTVVARFEAERQALAMMDHPNIARVFDGGSTPTGRPYFVMELVRGARMTEYCDENRLSTAQRLELFIQVCQAVQHAHQKGIIHRDLKPSNILITVNDGLPVPKVIDFGVAKAASGQALTDKTVYTAFEQFIGTPAYMSPEQTLLTSLDIDTRSDIYSLGVLLYELLTGGLPFDPRQLQASGIDEIRRTIREQEPPRPSVRLGTLGAGDLTTAAKRRSTEVTRLIHDVRGDLDWIVTKCLEKDRNRRYETANGLAADIQRHLSHEPIVARPPSRWYRVQKLARRHRAGVTAAAVMLVTLVAGLTLSTWAFVRERAARHLAAAEAAKSEAVAGFHKNMIESMKPSIALGRDTTLLREFADKSFENLGRDLERQPEVELELHAAIARVYAVIGEDRKAESIFQDIIPRMRKHLGKDNPELAPVLRRYAEVLDERGKSSESEAAARESLALTRKKRGPEHVELAYSLMVVGSALHSGNNRREAETYMRQSLEMYRRIRGPEHLDVATALGNVAIVIEHDGRPDEAEALYRESQAMIRRLYGDGHPHVVWVSKQLARFYLRRKKNLEEAMRLFEELLAAQRKLLGNENRQVARTLADLASTLIENGKLVEGETRARESLALHHRLYPEESLEVAATMFDLGWALGRLGRNAEAEGLFRGSLAMYRKLLPRESSRLALALKNLALSLHNQDKFTEEEDFRRELVELARADSDRQKHEPKSIEVRIYDLAHNLYLQKKHAEAEPLYRELVQRRSHRLPATDEDVIDARASLATLLSEWAWVDRTNAALASRLEERAREGEKILRECLALRLQGTNTGHWRINDVRSRLGGAMLSVLVTDRALSDQARTAGFSAVAPILLQAHEGIMPRNSPGSRRKRSTFERLIHLYEAWDKPVQAAEWRKKLAAFEKQTLPKKTGADDPAP